MTAEQAAERALAIWKALVDKTGRSSAVPDSNQLAALLTSATLIQSLDYVEDKLDEIKRFLPE